MVLSDAHAQDSGPGAEEQRRLELHRLAVDARRHRAVRVDLEARSGPPRHGRRWSPPCSPRPERAPTTVIPSTPSSIRGRVPEPTARPRR